MEAEDVRTGDGDLLNYEVGNDKAEAGAHICSVCKLKFDANSYAHHRKYALNKYGSEVVKKEDIRYYSELLPSSDQT